jgi:hypothetical protein
MYVARGHNVTRKYFDAEEFLDLLDGKVEI